MISAAEYIRRLSMRPAPKRHASALLADDQHVLRHTAYTPREDDVIRAYYHHGIIEILKQLLERDSDGLPRQEASVRWRIHQLGLCRCKGAR